MGITVIIPARYASTRLPGKPLLAETGKPLIRHVVESVSRSNRAERIVVATDDERILEAVRAFRGEAVMTGQACRTGTDRLADAATQLALADSDIVINVQGDEPDMPGWCADKVVELLEDSNAEIATLATPISAAEAELPSMTKVVLAKNGRALYFSRAKVPQDRDVTGDVAYYLHHGIYAYRVWFLKVFAALPSTPAEQAEQLEQLRALEHGHEIAVAVVEYRGSRIDTQDQYAAFVARTKDTERC